MRILTVMLLLFTLLACSDEWKKKDEVMGDGLKKGTAYEILDGRGNFTVFLDAIDRIGYRDLLDGKGLSTLFVPNDDAFKAYFTKHNIQGLDDIDLVDLEQLIGCHILRFAFRETELDNFQPQSGMEALPGLNYRHMSTIMPPIKEVYDPKNRKTVKVYNNLKYLPVFTTNLFKSLTIDVASNYNYFYPNTTWNSEIGIALGNAQVVESQIPTDNGYLYLIDQVVEPIRTVYNCIEDDTDFSDIKNIYDRFRTFVYNANASLQYASAGDSLYFMNVETHATYPLFNLADEWTSNGVWETQTYSYSFNAFLPTNEALQRFFQEYWEDPNANDQHYSSLEEVDKLPIYYLLENHIIVSNPAFPERIETVLKNSWGYSYTFDPEAAIRKEVCGNGVFIGIDEVQTPAIFQGVTKPVFQSPSYKIFSYILAKSGSLSELANSAAEYTLLVPSDNALGEAGYTLEDPGTTLGAVNVKLNGSNMNAASCLNFVRNHLISKKIDPSIVESDEEQWFETENSGNYVKIGNGQVMGENGDVADVDYKFVGEGEWNWSTFDLTKFVMSKDNWLQTAEKKIPYNYYSWYRSEGDFKANVIKKSNYFINGSSNLKPFTDNRGVFFSGAGNWAKSAQNDLPTIPGTATSQSKKELDEWLDKHVLTLEDNLDLSIIDFLSCKPLVGKTFKLHSEGWTLRIDQVDESSETTVLGNETEKDLGEYKLTMTVSVEGKPDHQAIAYGPHMATDCVFFVIRLPENRFVYEDNK